MIFCDNCFVDYEIKAIIKHLNHKGTCPLCGAKDAFLYDTTIHTSLLGVLDNLLLVYSAKADLPISAPDSDLKPITEILKSEWHVFSNISDSSIIDILKAISPEMYADFPEIFSEPVGIAEKYDSKYLKEHSILKSGKWEDFVYSIKHINRFHTKAINLQMLENYCRFIAEELPLSSKHYYRGRISPNSAGFLPSKMGAPPIDLSTDGRVNSAGISRLYLTDDKETTFHEIRAAEYDYVTIGTFKQLKPLRIVNLSRISQISPFAEDIDCTELAINKENLAKINDEMSRTARRGDSTLDYLPTQYICDFIMSIEDEYSQRVFDGVIYQSAMGARGYNLAVFDPDSFKCTYCRTFEITKLNYKRKPCKD